MLTSTSQRLPITLTSCRIWSAVTGPFVPRPTITTCRSRPDLASSSTIEIAGIHGPADLRVDVDPRHRRGQFRRGGEHHRVADRHHLGPGEPGALEWGAWPGRLAGRNAWPMAERQVLPGYHEPGRGLPDRFGRHQRRAAEPRAGLDLLLQGPAGCRTGEAEDRRRDQGRDDRGGNQRRGGAGGTRDGSRGQAEEPEALSEFGPQAVPQNRAVPASARTRRPGRSERSASIRRAEAVAAERGREADGERDDRPVPQVDAVGADAQPAQRPPGQGPADPARRGGRK